MITIYFGIYFYQDYKINQVNYSYLKSIDEKSFTEDIKKRYTLKRCSINIFNQEYYNVSGGDNDALITFYKINNDLLLTKINKNNFENYFSGFTRVKNTDLKTLLKMVKQDCYQFQKDYDNPNKNEIDWGYHEHEEIPPIPDDYGDEDYDPNTIEKYEDPELPIID